MNKDGFSNMSCQIDYIDSDPETEKSSNKSKMGDFDPGCTIISNKMHNQDRGQQNQNETKILIVETPDEDENHELFILSQLPFFNKLEDAKDQQESNRPNLTSQFSENNMNNTEKLYESINLEASIGNQNNDKLMTYSSESKTIKEKKHRKINTDEAIMFWKSKQHCILFSKLALSLLFNNIGLTLLIIFYILCGAWFFRKFELHYEEILLKQYYINVTDTANQSITSILDMYEKNVENIKTEAYSKNDDLKIKLKETKDLLDELIGQVVLSKENLHNTQTVISDQLQTGISCKNGSYWDFNNSVVIEEIKENITEKIKLLNNTISNILKQTEKIGYYFSQLSHFSKSNNSNVELFKNNSSSKKTSLLEKLLSSAMNKIINAVHIATKNGYVYNSSDLEVGRKHYMTQWTFERSILYCITVITTIGYGNITPKTIPGRIGTIIYAIIGIPIMVICLSHIGSLMANIFRLIYRISRSKAKKANKRSSKSKIPSINSKSTNNNESIKHDRDENNEKDERDKHISVIVMKKSHFKSNSAGSTVQFRKFLLNIPNPNRLLEAAKESESVEVPVSLVITVFIIYNIIGSIFFYIYENWDFTDSFYFSFITLSTIGFGDLVPVATGPDREQYKSIMCSFYVLFGLALCVMSFDLMERKCKSTVKNTVSKIKRRISKKESKPKKGKQSKSYE